MSQWLHPLLYEKEEEEKTFFFSSYNADIETTTTLSQRLQQQRRRPDVHLSMNNKFEQTKKKRERESCTIMGTHSNKLEWYSE